MISKGYDLIKGSVKYKDVDITQRIKWLQEKNFESIAFAKPTEYSYQKEFRIYLNKECENPDGHISENGIEIYNSVSGTVLDEKPERVGKPKKPC